MFQIENRGQALVSTNYWDSEDAQHGYCFLSWNAGAARLLVPDALKPQLPAMRSAASVIISRGPLVDDDHRDCLELLFEDHSDSPFVIHLSTEQSDRVLPASEHGSRFTVAIWTRGGCKARLPGGYRQVDALPCLKSWSAAPASDG